MHKKLYFNVFKNLVHADLLIFKDLFITKAIDVGIWIILNIIVMGYVMQYFGLSNNFGAFQLGGVIAAIGLFELYSTVVNLVSDLEGNRLIDYELTLPAPSWVTLMSKVTTYTIIYFLLSVAMLPLGKLALWNKLNLAEVSYIKLTIGILCASFFYGCFTLWTGSIIKNMNMLGTVWARYIFPMWFMGGFQFSWLSLLNVMPTLAYFSLLNPMIYVTECIRAAMLGQVEYINFWLCILAILFFSALSLVVGITNLKKRLDYV